MITKWNPGDTTLTRLFRIPAEAWSVGLGVQQNGDTATINKSLQSSVYSTRAVGRYSSSYDLLKNVWTGADLTYDGTVIALSGYDKTSLFLRCPGSTIAEALTSSALICPGFFHPSPGQVETSAWNSDGTKHLEIPEGPRPTMGWTTMTYDYAEILQNEVLSTIPNVCPRLEWLIQEDLQMICRTADEKSPKPDAWCHHSTNTVPHVHYLDDTMPPQDSHAVRQTCHLGFGAMMCFMVGVYVGGNDRSVT